MHDLNTINRLNAEKFAGSIQHFRAIGRYVLASYEGAHLVSIETFSDPDQLVDAYQAKLRTQQAGQHFVCHQPMADDSPERALAIGRDQSEDRARTHNLAILGAPLPSLDSVPADRTIGDYLSRKGY